MACPSRLLPIIAVARQRDPAGRGLGNLQLSVLGTANNWSFEVQLFQWRGHLHLKLLSIECSGKCVSCSLLAISIASLVFSDESNAG
jgi:hypothetical protein